MEPDEPGQRVRMISLVVRVVGEKERLALVRRGYVLQRINEWDDPPITHLNPQPQATVVITQVPADTPGLDGATEDGLAYVRWGSKPKLLLQALCDGKDLVEALTEMTKPE